MKSYRLRIYEAWCRSSGAYAALGLFAALSTAPTGAETVAIKYRGAVNLAPFACEWTSRSSFINRLCYDAKNQYVVVQLSGIYYHYCGVSAPTVAAWKGADSMGRFYNANIKGRFDCRLSPPPNYEWTLLAPGLGRAIT